LNPIAEGEGEVTIETEARALIERLGRPGPTIRADANQAAAMLETLLAENVKQAAALAQLHEAMATVLSLRRLSTTPEERETAKAAILVWRKIERLVRDTSPRASDEGDEIWETPGDITVEALKDLTP
jgi:hypothetical protein